ncbi:MAG: HlyD family efflux transporter periplasmic adaptor subunit, partial [Bacillota bacterium]|nr:HlyD family efflux transporter periplasmic adaptor subunit [Bacillota bacterium]
QPQPQPPQQPQGRFPTKDNVYSLQQERLKRQQEEAARQERNAAYHFDHTIGRNAVEEQLRVSAGKKRTGNMLLPLIVFAIIAVYLFGQLFLLVSKRTDVDVETVAYGTIDTPQIYDGLILRKEYVVNSSRTGQPFYQYSQGDYVSKNAVVCVVKETGTTEKLEKRLDQIDQDILKSQKTRTDLSAFSEDIARLENNVSRTVEAYAGRSMQENLSYMYTMKSQVESFMDQRNEIWLTENVESLSQLTEEKNTFEKQLAQSQSAMTASAAGILCLSYDGLEEQYHPDMAKDVTKKEIGSAKTQYISKAKGVNEGDPVFKVVESNEWSIVAYLPNTETATWAAGDRRGLNLLTEDGTVEIEGLVRSLELGEKETKVVFSTYEHMEAFMEDRMVSFSLEGAVQEGLKIPNGAIVEKSLLRIPRACLTESMGKDGVLKVDGEKTQFVDLSIITSDDEAVYIEGNDGTLKMGDVIVKGTGANAGNHVLSELSPHAGVYVANSSVADFVVIDILEQNQEYAIVKAGTIVGLQPFDTIVSDAKNIKEGDSIY